MQQHYLSRMLVAVMMVLFIIGGLASAQEENLLTNAGFEDGFASGVATGWTSWVSDAADAPGFQVAPAFLAGSTVEDNGLLPQIRSGSNAQAIFSFFETHDAGVYQQVSVADGAEYRFSIYAHVYSSSLSDLNLSEQPGGVTVRVGIDPTGGTDPLSDDVEYTESLITYDTYLQYSTIATAESDTITVFVRSSVSEPVQNTVVFFDDAVVNITPESNVPAETEEPVETEEPTEEVVETEEQVEDPTPTREGDVSEEETDEPVETDEPTEEPTEEETEAPVATEAPTEEPVETEETPTTEPTEETPISEDFPGTILHTVQRGDTVSRLAARYGSSTQAIIAANGLDNSALIFVGQGLIIPVRIVPATETPSATPVVIVVTATADGSETSNGSGGNVSGNTYVVQPGDSLSAIARRFNTTVGALVQLNGIANPNRILVGQELAIPGTGGSTEPVATEAPTAEDDGASEEASEEAPEQDNSGIIPPENSGDDSADDDASTSYVVQPGDNLFRIALRNGVSLAALAEANNITNFNLIFVGQVLTIP